MSLSGIEKYSQFVDIIDATNVIRVEMNSDDGISKEVYGRIHSCRRHCSSPL